MDLTPGGAFLFIFIYFCFGGAFLVFMILKVTIMKC